MIQNNSIQDYEINFEIPEDDSFKHALQNILNQYHQTNYPNMTIPEAKKFVLRVMHKDGTMVGGALLWTYWGWLEINLIALQEEFRFRGLGTLLMRMIEDKARQEGCTRIRVESFENELLFYRKMGYRIVGLLEDYPPGYCYYWMRKDLHPTKVPSG